MAACLSLLKNGTTSDRPKFAVSSNHGDLFFEFICSAKRIIVKPGERLSLQKHYHRSEHWIVVRGAARVTINEAIKTVHENESIYIPIGSMHRLENPGKILLELIEVQTGSYLGEDDILRMEDDYQRV